MKIIVTASGKDIESNIDSRFGRCAYFLVIDIEDNEIRNVDAVENRGNNQGHGAGISAAQQVGDLGAEKIITGFLGPNAFRVIQQLGIEAYHSEGKVKDAVEKLIQNNLEKITETVKGHFGMGRRWQN